MDYGQTLNLPKTDFPMRANLPQREPEILEFWEQIDIYGQVQKATAGGAKFILHDGPPYANGDIHLGTTLNKVLKDMVVKFNSQTGQDSPFVPGWDTHGLPIELKALAALKLNRHQIDPVELRHFCRDYALKYVDIQRKEFMRLGVRADWANPYLTLFPDFEAVQIGIFGEMAKKGYIYKGLKPVYWCSDCETALAEAEVEYSDRRSPSIYVKFPVKDARNLFEPTGVSVVIWTTTPWTLPANVAISVHPEFDYLLVKTGEEQLVLAEKLYQQVCEITGLPAGEVLEKFKGAELEGITCRNPLMDRDSLVILGNHVTLEQGTGCVHTAPGHGLEDFEVGQKYKLPVLSPLDDQGRFTSEGGMFAGMFVENANKEVVKELDSRGALVHFSMIQHQYPHCWRCKRPVLFRATEQWFASIDGFREAALAAIGEVRWIPAWGEERIRSMVAERGDWCISRQRAWGVPIPVFYCSCCNKAIITDETISHAQELFRQHGSDLWFERPASDLVPPGFTCPACGSRDFRKEKDIMDVWFDSGSSHAAVLGHRPGLQWPADLYLEGSDQHRGWFNSSLSTSIATKGTAPYRAVLTHGYVVDEQGRKMSKSLGNGVDPMEVIESLGADILRLWVASADYRRDVAASPKIMKQMSEAYRKIRNTCRFLIGNIYDFDPGRDMVSFAELAELDRWALLRLHKLIRRVSEAYREYEFHSVYHAVHNFCTIDMSSFYLDVVKDCLYCSPAGSPPRRAVQTVLYQVVAALVRLLVPILAFTTEEIWRYVPKLAGEPESVQLAGWPKVNEQHLNEDLEQKWDRLLAVRSEVSRALESARQAKLIGSSLEAAVDIYPDQALSQLLNSMGEQLPVIFIVSEVKVHHPGEAPPASVRPGVELPEITVSVRRAEGAKCERCWNYSTTVGASLSHPGLCQRCSDVLV